MTNYNLTNLTASQSFGDVVAAANGFTGDWLIAGTYIAFFVILVVTLKRYDFVDDVLASSWITTIAGFILTLGNWLNPAFMWFFLLVSAVFTLIKFSTEP